MVNEDGSLSPSAFIPFCGYGTNISNLGIKNNQFSVPVCNSFRPKVLNDQLCYEVDVNDFIEKSFLQKELKIGLMFMIDHNEDRQVSGTKGQDDQNYLLRLGKYNIWKESIIIWLGKYEYMNVLWIIGKG